jgi:hypothetical protein
MIKLTDTSVCTMLDLLIHTNGTTTTLEVKNELRNLGYFAEQSKVSEIMEILFTETTNYVRDNSKTNHFVYSWTVSHELNVGGYASKLDDSSDDDDDDTVIVPVLVPVSVVDSKEPTNIYYTDTHAKNHFSLDGDWVVFHKDGNNEVHIYNEILTRDNVRSQYAKLNHCKIQDVRSKRLTNYKK